MTYEYLSMNERRKYPRVNICVPVTYECYDDHGQIFEQQMALALDVSQGGMLIESEGGIIDANFIKVVIVNHENKELTIAGSVVHSRKMENGRTRTGICFHGTNRESIEFVANLIRAYFYVYKYRFSQQINASWDIPASKI